MAHTFRTQSVLRLGAALLTAAGLSGCMYDYLQRTDRVSYSAGNAVRANLERETANPTHGGMYDTDGLGKNGTVVDPAAAPAPAPAPAPTTP